MDKLDDDIKSSQKNYNPSSDFVETTLQQINNQHQTAHRRFKVWIPTLAGALVLLAIFIIIPLHDNNKSGGVFEGPSSSKSSSIQSYPTSQAAANGSSANGTNNASLTSDLNSVNNSISQESSDQSSANSALNDQSQEIALPTD